MESQPTVGVNEEAGHLGSEPDGRSEPDERFEPDGRSGHPFQHGETAWSAFVTCKSCYSTLLPAFAKVNGQIFANFRLRKVIAKIAQHVRRLSRARYFGVPFTRRASFRLPSSIELQDRSIPIASPSEDGAGIDFLTCFIDDEYGLNEIDFAVQTIADIGSNIGFFSIAARSYYPDAIIHSYEPNPRVLPYCRENAAVAGYTLFAEAVGAEAGYVSIEDTKDSNQARTIAASDGTVQIPKVSLSTVVERLGGQIDLAKIDCEGAEWELFSDRAAWKAIGHVRMEYHLWGTHIFSDVEQALGDLGFEIHRHAPSGEWGTVWARRNVV